MGNSSGHHHFLDIHYPASLSYAIKLEGGYEGECGTPNTIHLHNQSETACGCGATITFKRKDRKLAVRYRCKKSFENDFGTAYEFGWETSTVVEGMAEGNAPRIGNAVSKTEKLRAAAKDKLAASLQINRTAVDAHFVETGWEELEEGASSSLYVYHCYYNYDWVCFNWISNELKLKPDHKVTFEYKGIRYLQTNPSSCYGIAGPHEGYGLSANTVQSKESPLCFSHEGGRHKAYVKITF